MSQSYCVDCGMPVPAGQRVCSMCYGDIDYGRDGYYRDWWEAEQRDEFERMQAEEHAAEEERLAWEAADRAGVEQ